MRRQLTELRQVPPTVAEPVLQAEAEEWAARLGWRRPALLRQLRALLQRRRLAGWLFQVDGAAAGKVLVGEQAGVGSLEMAYVQPAYRREDHLAWMLGAAARHMLAHNPESRLEIGLFPFQAEDPGGDLRRSGFGEMWRDYMARPVPEQAPLPSVTLEPWPSREEEAARLLQQSYAGSADARACRFYGSAAGCRSYLRALLSGSECGGVSPELSGVVRDGSGQLQALLLGTTLSPEVAHLAQIAVRPDARGDGLGRALLAHFTAAAGRLGLRRQTLVATRENGVAYQWYSRLGFTPVESYVCYWRGGRPPR